MEKPSAQQSSFTVTIDTLVKLTGLSDRTLQRLAQNGVIEKPQRNQYNLLQCIPAIIRYAQAGKKLDAQYEGLDLEEELLKAQIENTQEAAKSKRIKNRQTDGELIPEEAVTKLLTLLCISFRTALQKLGDSIPDLMLEQTPEKAKATFELNSQVLLNEITQSTIQFQDAITGFEELPEDTSPRESIQQGDSTPKTPTKNNGKPVGRGKKNAFK
jgi:phage terminase Nu1 subunit (DNA packaging protein)